MVTIHKEKLVKITAYFDDKNLPSDLIKQIWNQMTLNNGKQFINQFELNGCSLIVWKKSLQSYLIEFAENLEKLIDEMSKIKQFEKAYEKYLKGK